MLRRLMILILACALATPVAGFADDKEKEQKEVRKAAKNALSAVYKAAPSAKKAVQSAAGYAAFSNFGMKILFAGSGTGKGIAVDNKTKATTYMKMFEVQAGLGFGVKKFSLVWVFETEEALKEFVDCRLGDRRPGDRGGQERGQGRHLSGCGRDRSRGLALPGHRQGARARAHRQGHQVLQGRRSELRWETRRRTRRAGEPANPPRRCPVLHRRRSRARRLRSGSSIPRPSRSPPPRSRGWLASRRTSGAGTPPTRTPGRDATISERARSSALRSPTPPVCRRSGCASDRIRSRAPS